MSDQKLTIDLRGVGNDIPTRLGKSRPTLTEGSLGNGKGAIQPGHCKETASLGRADTAAEIGSSLCPTCVLNFAFSFL